MIYYGRLTFCAVGNARCFGRGSFGLKGLLSGGRKEREKDEVHTYKE